MAEPTLIAHTVTLHISADTHTLLDEMAYRQHLSFDALAQVLVMYGAFLLASADLGLLEGLGLADLSPQRITPTIRTWLHKDKDANTQQGQ